LGPTAPGITKFTARATIASAMAIAPKTFPAFEPPPLGIGGGACCVHCAGGAPAYEGAIGPCIG